MRLNNDKHSILIKINAFYSKNCVDFVEKLFLHHIKIIQFCINKSECVTLASRYQILILTNLMT